MFPVIASLSSNNLPCDCLFIHPSVSNTFRQQRAITHFSAISLPLARRLFRDITRSSCTIAQDYFIFRNDLNRDRYAHARATTVSAYSTWTGIIHGDSPFNVVTLSTKGFPAKREGLSASRPKVRLSQNQFAKAIPENRKITALVH